MKTNNMKILAVIMVVGLMIAVAAGLVANIIKVPAIIHKEFDYAVTYQLDGETKTIQGVYTVDFNDADLHIEPWERYYTDAYRSEPSAEYAGVYPIANKDGLELLLVVNFWGKYMMGDDDSQPYDAPYLQVIDEEGYIYEDEQTIGNFDVELLSWQMPQPIENTFAFAGFSLMHIGSMLVVLAAGILTLVACLVFVKKDPAVTYKTVDKISVVVSWLVGLGAIPLLTVIVWLLQITFSLDDVMYQVFLCLPALSTFGLSASVALRRNGFVKSGLILQLIGPGIFLLYSVAETLVYNLFG